MTKIKERSRRKAALTDRKSAAAQARMKNITSLATDERVPKTKKRKVGGGKFYLSKSFFKLLMMLQRTLLARTMLIGPFIERSFVLLLIHQRQLNTFRTRLNLNPTKRKTLHNCKLSNRSC